MIPLRFLNLKTFTYIYEFILNINMRKSDYFEIIGWRKRCGVTPALQILTALPRTINQYCSHDYITIRQCSASKVSTSWFCRTYRIILVSNGKLKPLVFFYPGFCRETRKKLKLHYSCLSNYTLFYSNTCSTLTHIVLIIISRASPHLCVWIMSENELLQLLLQLYI